MRIGFIQGNAGASGDMLLGALIDAGLPLKELEDCLAQLKLLDTRISAHRVTRNGITGTKVTVEYPETDHHRHLHNIEKLITESDLVLRVKNQALKVFRNLAKAEAAVHNCPVEEVHFHEVGAVDAIVDVVGSCFGFDYFGIEQLFCSPLRVGFGEVKCAHGLIPVPVPATVRLLSGVPVYAGEYGGEWVTPTGAAILTTWCSGWREMPLLIIEQTGYGAGASERAIPNLLHLIIGKTDSLFKPTEKIEVLETNIDDLNPEFLPYLGEKLLTIPVLDYQFTPVVMKKGRIGIHIIVLTELHTTSQALEVLFRETSTLGIRRTTANRVCLQVETKMVEVYGKKVRIKTGLFGGKMMQSAPEFEDCKVLAQALGVPLKEIYDLAKKTFLEKYETRQNNE